MPISERIEAELTVPDVVHLPTTRKSTVNVDVLARLHNTGDEGFVIGTSDPDDVHHWHVFNENHKEVMRPPPASKTRRGRAGVHPHTSHLITSGHSHNAPATLKLDATKLRAGKTYTVRYVFHGYTAEGSFVVLAGKAASKVAAKRAPARKARKAPKAAAKKRAPARKAARRKTKK